MNNYERFCCAKPILSKGGHYMVKRSISFTLVFVLVFIQVLGYPIFLPSISKIDEVYALTETKLPIQYDDFSNVDELQFNGSSLQSGSSIIVSPSVDDTMGTIFFKQAINLKSENSFSTYFSFRLTEKNDPWGSSGADGFTFILQPISASTINETLSCPGFGISQIRTCAAIEFDTYKGTTDPSGCHIGINLSGSYDSLKTANITTLNAGTTYHAWIDYDGASNTIEARLSSSDTRPTSATLTYNSLDLQSYFGDVPLYAGFSAASGKVRQNHIIDKWYLDNEYNPIDIKNNTYTEGALLSVSANDYADRTELTIEVTDHNGNSISDIGLEASVDNGTLSSTSGVTDANGQVILDLTNATNDKVNLSVETETGITIEKVIQISSPMTDAQIIVSDSDDLTVNDILNGNTSKDNILTDLSLPLSGAGGSDISWHSDQPSIISNSGTVARPEYSLGDQIVTLEATISKGVESTTKTFTLTVKSLTMDEKEALEDDFAWLTLDQILNGNNDIDHIISSLTFPNSAPKGSTITYDSNNTSYIQNSGQVNRPSYEDGNQVVEVKATLQNSSLKKTKYFSFNVKKELPTDSYVLSEDIKWLSVNRILESNNSQYNITSDLNLINQALNGSTITWQSSDTTFITHSGNVNRPNHEVGNKEITLSAILTKGAETKTVDYELTVTALPDGQPPALISSLPKDKIVLNELNKIIYEFDEPIKSEKLNEITYHKKTKEGYTQPVFGIEKISKNKLEIEILGEVDDYDLQIIIPKDTITDFSGNSYNQILQKEYYYQAKQPVLITSNPKNEAKNIPANVPISLTFDEAIKVDTSKIKFYKEVVKKRWYGSRYTERKIIPIKTHVSNQVLDIIPQDALLENSKYVLQIQSDGIKNNLSKTLSDAINIEFNTAKTSGKPAMVSYSTSRQGNEPVRITFNQQIKIDESKILRAKCYVEGNQLYIQPSYSSGTEITFKEGAIKGLNGEEAIYPSNKSWRKVEKGWWWSKKIEYKWRLNRNDTSLRVYRTIPRISDYVPIDGVIKVDFSNSIMLNESVGKIQLNNSRGQSVEISKIVEGNALKIRPVDDWIPYVNYYLNIPEGAVKSGGNLCPAITTFVKAPDKVWTNNCNFTVSKNKVFINKPVRISTGSLERYFSYRGIRSYSYKIDGVEISNTSSGTYVPDHSSVGKKQVQLDMVDGYGFNYTYHQTIKVINFSKYDTVGKITKPNRENIYNHTKIEDVYSTDISLQNKGISLDNEEVTASLSKRKYKILDLFICKIKIPDGYTKVLSDTQKTDQTGTASFSFDIDALESSEYIVKYSSASAYKLPTHYLNIKKLSDMATLKVKLVDKNTNKTVASDKSIKMVINGTEYSASKENNQYVIHDLLPLKSEIQVNHSYYYDETVEMDLWPSENELAVLIERDVPSEKPLIRHITSNQTDSRDSTKKIFIDGVNNTITFKTELDWKGHEPGQLEYIALIPDANGNHIEKKYYSKNGKLKINVGKNLGSGARMLVRAVSKDGSISASHDLGFEVAPGLPLGNIALKNNNYLININLDLGEMAGASIPDDWPLIGGDDLGFEVETLKFGGILTDDGTIDFRYGYTPNVLEQIKENGNILENYKDLRNNRNAGKYSSGDKDFGMSLDGKVSWQYKVEENAWFFKHGEVEIKIEGEISHTQYFWLFVVPAYLRGTLGVEAAAKLEVDAPKSTYNFSGEIEVEPSVEIALGAGVDGLNLEGFLGGAIDTKFTLPDCDFSAKGSIEGGARASILFWSWEKKAIEYNWQIYKTAALMPQHITMYGMLTTPIVMSQNEKAIQKEMTEENFTIMNRNIGSNSQWVANKPVVMAFSKTPTYVTRQVLKNNIFPDAQPKLINSNGEVTLIWSDDNPERTSTNRTELSFSKYSQGKWDTPKRFGLDGTADFAVDAVPRSGGAITVWTDMNQVFGENVTMEENLASGEITAVCMDKETFKDKETITNDAYYDSMADIVKVENDYLTVWVKNRGNSILSPKSGMYDIYYAVNNGTGWSPQTPLEQNLNAIVQLNVESYDNKAVVVYTVDKDSNILTNSDWEMYASVYENDLWSTPVPITNNSLSDGNPRVTFDGDKELIFWLQDGQLKVKKGINGNDEMVSEDIGEMISSFEIVQNDDGIIGIVFVTTGLNGLQHLNMLLYDINRDTISQPIELTSGENNYSQITPEFIENDEIMVAFTETEMITETIDGKEYKNVGHTDLVTIRKPFIHDIKVESHDIHILSGNGAAGSTNIVSVTIHNEGDYPKSGVKYQLMDNSQNPISQEFVVAEMIPANDAITVEKEWIVPDDYSADTAVVVIDSNHEIQDCDRTNNSAEFDLCNDTVQIKNIQTLHLGDNQYSVTAEIFNPSGRTLNNCELSLYHEGVLGSLITKEGIGDINSLDKKRVTFELDAKALLKANEQLKILAVPHNSEVGIDEKNGLWFILESEVLNVKATYPANDAYNVPLDQEIELQFSRPISKDSGITDIKLYNDDGITCNVSTTVDNTILRIKPLSALTSGSMYTLSIPTDAVKSIDGRSLKSEFTMKLFTLDTTNLGVIGSYPTQGMAEIELEDTIKINFTNDIKEGDLYGDIKIYDEGNNQVGITKQITGKTLEIDPKQRLNPNATYTVEIPEVSLYDTSNKPLDQYYAITFHTKTDNSSGSKKKHSKKADMNLPSNGFMLLSSESNDLIINQEQLSTAINHNKGLEIQLKGTTLRLPINFNKHELMGAQKVELHTGIDDQVNDDKLPKDKRIVSNGCQYLLVVDGKPINQATEKLYIEIPLDKANIANPRKAVAYYKKDNGEWMAQGGIYNEEKGTLTIGTKYLGTFIVLEGDKEFDDVVNSWSKEAIEILASRDVINGKSENQFDPSASVSRAEFTALIVRALYEEKIPYSSQFDDIVLQAWYSEEVEKAVELGLVSGIGEGVFAPENHITREQICTILYRVISMYQEINAQETLNFSDEDEISSYAKEAVAVLYELDILRGYDNKILPKANATREEAAVLIFRVLDKLNQI